MEACVDLLTGNDTEPDLIVALGGPPARWLLTGEAGGPPYWLRVWGARGLLWAWDDSAQAAVGDALADEAWRVREMALKVVARHGLGDLLAEAARLQQDPVARVRSAAARTLARITAEGG